MQSSENEEILMSYIAGIMDGDGSFSIRKIKNASASPLYFPLIQFGTQREKLIELLKDKVGGYVHEDTSGTYSIRFYHWFFRGIEHCTPFLEKIIKHLSLKRERAQYLLNFCKEFEFIRGKKLEKDVLAGREKSYVEMCSFNDSLYIQGSKMPKRPVANSQKKEFWAYVAGIMDTDASFSIKKQKYQYGIRYNATISIDMVDCRTIDYIASQCKFGKVYANKNDGCTKGCCYRLALSKKEDIIEFIENTLPYLYIKNEQAKTLLEFCQNWKNTGYCKAGVPPEEMAFREEYHQKIKQLNKYGVYKPTLIDLEA